MFIGRKLYEKKIFERPAYAVHGSNDAANNGIDTIIGFEAGAGADVIQLAKGLTYFVLRSEGSEALDLADRNGRRCDDCMHDGSPTSKSGLMIHRHDTECNNKIRFYAKMTPSLFMGRKHTQIRIPFFRCHPGTKKPGKAGRSVRSGKIGRAHV